MKEDAGFLMKFIKNDRENLSHSCDIPFDYSHSFVPVFSAFVNSWSALLIGPIIWCVVATNF